MPTVRKEVFTPDANPAKSLAKAWNGFLPSDLTLVNTCFNSYGWDSYSSSYGWDSYSSFKVAPTGWGPYRWMASRVISPTGETGFIYGRASKGYGNQVDLRPMLVLLPDGRFMLNYVYGWQKRSELCQGTFLDWGRVAGKTRWAVRPSFECNVGPSGSWPATRWWPVRDMDMIPHVPDLAVTDAGIHILWELKRFPSTKGLPNDGWGIVIAKNQETSFRKNEYVYATRTKSKLGNDEYIEYIAEWLADEERRQDRRLIIAKSPPRPESEIAARREARRALEEARADRRAKALSAAKDYLATQMVLSKPTKTTPHPKALEAAHG